MKKRKKNTKFDCKTSKLNKLLDSKYFHVCVTYASEGKEMDWAIYYKNLPPKVYYSDLNKALLTSENNTYEDVYELNNIFEKEKNKIKAQSKREIFNTLLPISAYLSTLNTQNGKLLIDISLINLIFNTINAVTERSKLFCIFSLSVSILIAILITIRNNENSKEEKKCKNKIEENIIQEKLKRQGLYFVDTLKKELNKTLKNKEGGQ